MTKRQLIYHAALVALVALCAMQGSSFAATVRDPSMAIQPPEERWNWRNPLDGSDYDMKRFDDGVIVAIRYHMVLDESRGNFFRMPELIYQPATDSGPSDVYRTRPQLWDEVHGMWNARRLSCSVKRTVPDLFGNSAKVCQLSPFSFKVTNGTLSTAKGGVVWIITPTVSGNQTSPTSGSQPTWGR
jgi:hypothetical protein